MDIWIAAKDQLPNINEEVLILIPEEAIPRTGCIRSYENAGWFLTDCKHPLQNFYRSFEGTKWRND